MPSRFNFGRVFFPGVAKVAPDVIRFQPLGDHVGNVRRLVKQWADFPKAEYSQQRVLKAADLHDMGKPKRFAIQVEMTPKGKFKNYIYSFRGHRFLARSTDLWAQTLARGHHDFSVADISRDTYELRKACTDYADLLAQEPLAYAHELYILEMCDQIEAELACRVIGDEHQAKSRTFMECTISKGDDDLTYLLDPWFFQDESLELKFKYWSKYLTDAEKQKLQALAEKGQSAKLGNTLDGIVKEWWRSQTEKLAIEQRTITLKPLSRETLEIQKIEEVYQKLAEFSPNPMQVDMYEAIVASDHPAILLKGGTGAGKTEAVLLAALAKGYRLMLPLPARSLLEDQKNRIEKYLLKFSELPENIDREIDLVVDTGAQMHRYVYQNGKEITPKLGINPRRHLYKGRVILTTIDKFVYRYFSFGDKQKSFIFPLRINRDKTIICFDEAHSYDDISFTNFRSLVQALYEAGRSIVLMTATMPPENVECFGYLDIIDYIDNKQNIDKLTEFQNQTIKQPYLGKRFFTWMSDVIHDPQAPEAFQSQFARIILQVWQAKAERRILAVVETVKDAVAIYQELKAKLKPSETSDERYLFLYHGRIADKDRIALYQQIQQRDEQKLPYILVTTSAIEVGCDLNAEILISQICPPENLIQRAGRCNRRGDVEDARVIVVGDRIPDFANSLDEAGWQNYQKTLQHLNTFDSQAITACISRSQHIDDYRVVELFSMLHNYVYNADLTCQPAHEKGLVITRSWTPSVTLVYDDGEHGDWSNNLSELPQISVPLDRLIKKLDDSNLFACVDVYEKYYDQETTRYSERPLTWGWAYQKDILIRIGKSDGIQPEDPYIYDPELGFVDLPGVFTKWRSKGSEQRLEYKLGKDSKSAVISYIKPLTLEPIKESAENPAYPNET